MRTMSDATRARTPCGDAPGTSRAYRDPCAENHRNTPDQDHTLKRALETAVPVVAFRKRTGNVYATTPAPPGVALSRRLLDPATCRTEGMLPPADRAHGCAFATGA